jgi:transcriptional regulator
MPTSPNELLHGTLDVLILKSLSDRARHGYGLVRHVAASTGGAVAIEDGSLYPALYRLERKGQVRGDWGVTDAGRRARFYRLTAKGRTALSRQSDAWTRFAEGVSNLLRGGAE